MSKLIIEIDFGEEIPKNEQDELASHLSGLIAEEFIYFSEEYPDDINITEYFVEDKDE